MLRAFPLVFASSLRKGLTTSWCHRPDFNETARSGGDGDGGGDCRREMDRDREWHAVTLEAHATIDIILLVIFGLDTKFYC